MFLSINGSVCLFQCGFYIYRTSKTATLRPLVHIFYKLLLAAVEIIGNECALVKSTFCRKECQAAHVFHFHQLCIIISDTKMFEQTTQEV